MVCRNCCSHPKEKKGLITSTTESGRHIRFIRRACEVCGAFLGDRLVEEAQAQA